jgi:hypothetical protein
MIIDEDTDGIEVCQCGHKPTQYSIAYGRTPYSIHCACGKSLHGGCDEPEWFFSFWNDYVRHVKTTASYGLRYEDNDRCRLETPLIYETSCMGLFTVGKALNEVTE